MTDTTTTGTLIGWKMWSVIGILGTMLLLIGGGWVVPETRPYVKEAVTWCMNAIAVFLKS
jgi:hypothetical protein